MTEDLVSVAEQEERLQPVREFASRALSGEWSIAQLRDMIESGDFAASKTLWARLRDLEWDRVLVGDEAMGAPALCVMAEELGRHAAPAPLVAAAVGAHLLDLAGMATGGRTIVPAFREQDRVSRPLQPRVEAQRTESGYRISGTKSFIPWAGHADDYIVSAQVSDGQEVGLFRIGAQQAGVSITPLAALDWWPIAVVGIDDVAVAAGDVLALGNDADSLLAKASDLETLGYCAELLGVARRAHDVATDYARQRVAFDRPIGSFQAVKHRLVDQRGDIEIADALIGAAAQAIDLHGAAPSAAVARAAFWCSDTLRRVPEGALQVLGGIGYTWEHDFHFHLRRAATLVALLGERAAFRDRIISDLVGADDRGDAQHQETSA